MQRKMQKSIEMQVFGDYRIQRSLPFRIVQAPFRKSTKYKRDGHWNEKERLKYTVFLGFFRKLLEEQELKRNARVYEMMSDMIITRSPSQCRSHHQKMEKNKKNITDIISSTAEKYEPSVYAEMEERYTGLIKTLLDNADKYIRIPTSSDNQRSKPPNTNNLAQATLKPRNMTESISIYRAEDENFNWDQSQHKQANVQAVQGNQIKEQSLAHQIQAQSLIKQEEELAKGSAEDDVKCVLQKKNDMKKTQDEYSDEESSEKQESGSFEKYFLREEGQQHRKDKENLNQLQEEHNIKYSSNQMKQPISIFQETPHQDTFRGTMSQESYVFFEQELVKWRQQKQGYSATASQLLIQWNACNEYLRICEENIRYFENALNHKKNALN